MAGEAAKVESLAQIVEGRVKWFDPSRGYGFIETSDGHGDVLLHASRLRMCGKSSASEGARIKCLAIAGEKGRQAVEILDIKGGDTEAPRPRRFHPRKEPGENVRAAVVKWFDADRGYGFLDCDGVEGDVFLHAATLRKAGIAEVHPGETMQARCTDGPKGVLAAEVYPTQYA
ncbi:cold shock domain-containing protein [Hyphobacterium sp.]|jgi:CspA family cold shock protein|uniref:cold shock domain-containing protein n=1 Tax=Hyphobacterium sp. TaxID=2004662 RepID=UPI003BAD02A5